MVQARWNGVVIAQSDDTEVVEGNHYFAPADVRMELLKPSQTTTVCGWKGTAHYYTITADGKENIDAAWYYPETKPEADHIKGRIAFWKGVEVS
ncbi:MAG: DUF427 domain-containing protein [Hyphomicrobiaceae bacterium]